MKAYTHCPGCGKDNSAEWLNEFTYKPYITCMCAECNRVYNQQLEVQDTKKSTIIKPDHIDPVPIIINMIYKVPDKDKDLPGKPVANTTSQARIN